MGLTTAHALLVLGPLAAPALASDLVVEPNGSIQAAIDAAVDGDRVLVKPGVYAETIDFLGKAIEVVGLGGPHATAIDASSLGIYTDPVVRFHEGEGPDSILRGFTVRGATALAFGAGISAFDAGATASPTIEDCVVRDNRSLYHGGGVAGNPTLVRCAILENSAYDGGGVWGAPTMTRCLVSGNSAWDGVGGGVHVYGGTASIDRCVITANESFQSAKGGGVYVAASGGGAMLRSVLVANHLDGMSGLYTGFGGAAYLASGATFVVDRCTIVDNSSTISMYGYSDVGGLYGSFDVRNSIVRGNVGIELYAGAVATWSNVEGGWPGVGNFDADPLFVNDLTNDLDLHLRPGSTCVDAGDPTLVDPDGTRADVGAYYLQSFYALDAVAPDSWSDPSWPSVSALTGGKARYRVFAGPAAAGNPYVVLGSLSGTSPGTPLLGVTLPLVLDSYFLHTLTHLGAPPYQGQLGLLDPSGTADVVIALPPGVLANLAPLTAWHAAAVLDPALAVATLATNAEVLQIVE